MSDTNLDIEKLKNLQFKIMKDVAASALIPLMRIGEQLGLCQKRSEVGPINSKKYAYSFSYIFISIFICIISAYLGTLLNKF